MELGLSSGDRGRFGLLVSKLHLNKTIACKVRVQPIAAGKASEVSGSNSDPGRDGWISSLVAACNRVIFELSQALTTPEHAG